MQLLLMGLSTELDRHYILESWKKITSNAIIIVNTLMELQMIFYQ